MINRKLAYVKEATKQLEPLLFAAACTWMQGCCIGSVSLEPINPLESMFVSRHTYAIIELRYRRQVWTERQNRERKTADICQYSLTLTLHQTRLAVYLPNTGY